MVPGGISCNSGCARGKLREVRAKQLPHSWDGQGSPRLGEDGAEQREQLLRGDTEPGTCAKPSLRGLPAPGKQEANSCAQVGSGGLHVGKQVGESPAGSPDVHRPAESQQLLSLTRL